MVFYIEPTVAMKKYWQLSVILHSNISGNKLSISPV